MKQKAEEIYHRFVNYEWNDVSEGLKKSILEAIETALTEGQKLPIHNVSKSLPTKKYKIDFGGNVLAGLEISNNEPTVIGAMNGWGNGISKDDITITEK